MDQWLENFAYRIRMNGWIVAMAARVTLIVAFVTVSFQALRVLMSIPVNSLSSK
jgi:putative ABC transport system permease protein